MGSKTGKYAHVFFDEWDPSKVITGTGSNTTTAGQWYLILAKGAGSALPLPEEHPIRGPQQPGATQYTLVTGDQIYPFDMQRYCKTAADISASQGTVDTSTDCDTSSILDGNKQYSGSISALFNYNDVTGDFDPVTEKIANKFFDIIEDAGTGAPGSVVLKPINDDRCFLLINLNSDAKVGQTEHWIFLPVIFSELSLSLGLTDIQNRDLAWTKGEGAKCVQYSVPKAAA